MNNTAGNPSAKTQNRLSFNHLSQCYKPFKKALGLTLKEKTRKPFFIILGQPESGKSAFIESAETILSEQQITLHNKLAPCHLYQCQQANWIKVPGEYLVQLDSDGKKTLCHAIKKAFRYYKAEITLSGIVVVFDLYDMLTRSKFSNHNRLDQINQFLIAFNYIYSNPFSVNFFLNKCDLIPGFYEFFSNRDKEFRDQAWGFPINETSESSLTSEFNCLIKNINAQLIWRLRHETQQNKLYIIKEFPIKIEHLKARLTPLLSEYFQKLQPLAYTKLEGLYLVSCHQFNVLETSSEITSNLTITQQPNSKQKQHKNQQTTQQSNSAQKNFFIKNAYQKIIMEQKEITNKNSSSRLAHSSFILLCATIVAGCIFFLSHQLSDYIKLSSQTQTKLNEISKELFSDNNLNLIEKTKQLESIDQLIKKLEQQNNSHFPGSELIFHTNNSGLADAKALRDKYIETQWLTSFASQLESIIQEKLDTNPEKAYIALKIYLMLWPESQNTEIQSGPEMNYINQHLAQVLPPEVFLIVSRLPENLSNNQLKNIQINENIITKARDYFVNLQTEQLAYVILFSNVDLSQALNLKRQFSINNILSTDAEQKIIPAIYTKQLFDQTMAIDIPNAANEAIIGNQTIGRLSPNETKSNPEYIDQFIQKLRKQYIKTYTETWEQVLQHTHLIPANNLRDFSQQLKLLSSGNSVLLTFIQTIYDNTHIDLIENESEVLSNLNKTLTIGESKNKNPLFNSFVAIHQLENNISKIIKSRQPDRYAFDLLKTLLDKHLSSKNNNNKQAMSNLISASNSLPNPLRLWMLTLSNQYYQLLAKSAGDYINQIWLNQIAKPFHKNFSANYPFNSKSDSDLNLIDFNHFFMRGGTLDNFESQYILPLLSQNQQGWGVNLSISNTLQIPHDVMQQLQNLAKIQENFFGKNANSADIDFSIAITELPKDIKSISFNTGGSTLAFDDQHQQPINLTWPALSNSNMLTITVVNKNNQAKVLEYNGSWAWLKAIDELSTYSDQNKPEEENIDHNSEQQSTSENSIILSVPSNSTSNVEVILQFESNNQFSKKLLSQTWMPYWIFKQH